MTSQNSPLRYIILPPDGKRRGETRDNSARTFVPFELLGVRLLSLNPNTEYAVARSSPLHKCSAASRIHRQEPARRPAPGGNSPRGYPMSDWTNSLEGRMDGV